MSLQQSNYPEAVAHHSRKAHEERGTCELSWIALAAGPVLLVVQGEVVYDLRKGATLDEDGWVSCQQRVPTNDGQLGWKTLQMENTVVVGTASGLSQATKLVVKKLKLETLLAARPKQIDP